MAGAGIIKAEYNDAEFQEIIDALGKASSPDLLELANFAGAELHRISVKAFEAEKDPVTEKSWQPLKSPRPDGSTNPILNYGGQLKRSIVWEALADGSVTVGSNMVYARIHQQGGDAGRDRKSHIPARPYLGIPKDFNRRILNDPAILALLGF